MNQLTAVVLAAGCGTRFWPLSKDKLTFPFFGKPFIEYSILNTLPKEVTRIVVIANQDTARYYKNLKFPVPHVVVIQREARGMADALLSARQELAGSRLLIIIADHLVNASLYENVITNAEKSDAFGVIPGWKTTGYFPGGYLVMDQNRIRAIVEKPGAEHVPSPYVAVSGHFIRDSDVLLEELAKTSSNTDDVYEKALSSLMRHTVFNLESYDGVSVALKYPWHVLDVMKELFHFQKNSVGRNVEIHDHVTITGDVVIADNVKIFENTKIVGPVYIGEDTIIGNNNIIRDSHIGSACVTGFNTDITRSYIGDSCWFHSNYIGDSVLEGNVSLGSQAVLANLRLDEGPIFSTIKDKKEPTGRNKLGVIMGSNIRVGIHASIMPGVKIGSDSFIASGALISSDVSSGSYVETKQEIVIKRNTVSVPAGNRSVFRAKLK